MLLNHLTFYLSYLGMNYNNVIGFLIFIVFLLQFMSGLLLSCYHSPMIPFSSVYYIMIDVNVGWLIRIFHILGASMFMVLVYVHWIRGIWIRLRIKEQNKLNNISHRIRLNLIWVSGWVILLFTLLSSFIGYILNWGQMSYWGITVMINILSVLPLFGSYIGDYVWCSSLVIVNRMFILHFTLGFIIASLILCHLALLHNFSSWNPLINNHSFLILFFLLFFKDAFVSYVIPLFISFYLFWDPDIFSNADNLITANPLSTPTHILPEWYFNIVYSILRAFPNKTMGVIIVVLFIGILLNIILWDL